MATRDEVHRLVDAVPDDQLTAVVEVVRAAIEAGMSGEEVLRVAELVRAHGEITRAHIDPGTLAQLANLASTPALAHFLEVAERLRAVMPTGWVPLAPLVFPIPAVPSIAEITTVFAASAASNNAVSALCSTSRFVKWCTVPGNCRGTTRASVSPAPAAW